VRYFAGTVEPCLVDGDAVVPDLDELFSSVGMTFFRPLIAPGGFGSKGFRELLDGYWEGDAGRFVPGGRRFSPSCELARY
jgi:hypothetical protein